MKSIYDMGAYFSSLLNVFKKRDILIDLQHAFNELETTVLPMYDLATTPTYLGDTNKRTSATFKRTIKSYRDTPAKTFKSAIKLVLANQDGIMDLVKKEFQDETQKVAMDYYRLNLIKYIEAITFFIDYTRMWNTVVTYETVLLTKPEVNIKSPTILRDSEFVNNITNIDSFSVILNMLVIPFDKYVSSIQSLKGQVYQESDWGDSNVALSVKVDPYKVNFIPVTLNPFYHIGMLVNTWRVNRYKRNQAELSRVQLMLATLEDSASQEINAEAVKVLENQIAYYSNVANKLSTSIEKMEQA